MILRRGNTAGPAELATRPEIIIAYIVLGQNPYSFQLKSFTANSLNLPTSQAMTRTLSPKKHVQSVTSDYPWRSDNPFGPPQIPRSFPSGIKRLRDTLSKLAPSSFAEKELLRTKNHHRVPLTERNVDTLVTEQECDEAYRPNLHSPNIQVTEWLRRVS